DVDPEYLNLVAFFLGEFRDHYHLPTGAHDLHLLETGKISDDEFFDRMCARYAEAGNPPVDARTAQKVIFGRGMVASSAMAAAQRAAAATQNLLHRPPLPPPPRCPRRSPPSPPRRATLRRDRCATPRLATRRPP